MLSLPSKQKTELSGVKHPRKHKLNKMTVGYLHARDTGNASRFQRLSIDLKKKKFLAFWREKSNEFLIDLA